MANHGERGKNHERAQLLEKAILQFRTSASRWISKAANTSTVLPATRDLVPVSWEISINE